MLFRTAAPMTVKGPRKGEPSLRSMRNGLRAQPAQLVRGSSRRIMTMRFRPANIRVINRRVCSLAVIGTAVRTEALRAHQQERVPPAPPIEVRGRCQNGARRQGFASPRRARPCLLCAVLAGGPCDGRLRREHSPHRFRNKRERPASSLRRKQAWLLKNQTVNTSKRY